MKVVTTMMAVTARMRLIASDAGISKRRILDDCVTHQNGIPRFFSSTSWLSNNNISRERHSFANTNNFIQSLERCDDTSSRRDARCGVGNNDITTNDNRRFCTPRYKSSSAEDALVQLEVRQKQIRWRKKTKPGNRKMQQHTSKEWWDGVVPPWSAGNLIGRRELRPKEDAAASLQLEQFYHMRKIDDPEDGEVYDNQVDLQTIFAIIEVGAQQFKVTPNDIIYTEKLKDVDINDKVTFGRVLLVGTPDKTTVGRPYITDAHVTAVIEEQFQNGKVFVFKKKRRKNYRRFNTHRQDLTGLRILSIKSTI